MVQQYPDATHHPYLASVALGRNVTVILSDALAFLAVVYQILGLWKEKRKLQLYTNKDFVTLLLQQGILRFSFALVVSVAQLIIGYDAADDISAFQNVLSTILICEFTLDLRRRNTTKPLLSQSALELPDLNLSSQHNPGQSIQTVLGRLQKSIIANMGERNDPVDVSGINGPGEEPNPSMP
ncbi:hypothetical protein Clacol_004395 [Clathrus columnatus]|uniref:Uncharacterized protein n=1 Tax=Clathrus columnatus TaxID=1419009 RepID=A0AAV5A6C0_9AGAM|nr:hypothetical protein Clacol_004395 [Clathrus columnatus]